MRVAAAGDVGYFTRVDTITIARALRAADMPPAQAEAVALAIARSVAETAASKTDLDLLETRLIAQNAATRADLKSEIAEVRADLKSEIAELRTEVRQGLSDLKSGLLTWMIVMIVALGGFLVAVLKL